MATKYIKEPEDKKFSGDGVRAMRRHGGTMVMTYGVKMRVLLAAAGIFVPDMTHLKRCGFFGGAMSKRERLRRAKKKDSVYPIGDGENKIKKARSSDKKRGPRWDLNPRGYEQGIGPAQQRTGKHEPSSCAWDRGHKSYKHQDNRTWATCKEAKHGDQRKCPKGTAATARAKGGVKGRRT
jgi:hypothetical protein